MSKITKEDLKSPDAFLTSVERFWHMLERHAVSVFGTLALVFVIALVKVSWDYYMDHTEKAAADQLQPIQSEFDKLKQDFDKAKFQAVNPKPPETPKKAADKDVKAEAKTEAKKDEPKAATGNLAKDYGSVVTKLEGFVGDNSAKAAGARAAIMLANLYLDYKQPEKAVAVAAKVEQSRHKEDMLAGLTKQLLGTAQAQKGDCKSAIETWKKVADQPKFSFLKADAALKTGLCYEILGDLDKAKENYEKASATGAESQVDQTAKTLLRALEFKKSTDKSTEKSQGKG